MVQTSATLTTPSQSDTMIIIRTGILSQPYRWEVVETTESQKESCFWQCWRGKDVFDIVLLLLQNTKIKAPYKECYLAYRSRLLQSMMVGYGQQAAGGSRWQVGKKELDAENSYLEFQTQNRKGQWALGMMQGCEASKPPSVTYLLQQGHTSTSPDSTTHWESRVQIHNPLGGLSHSHHVSSSEWHQDSSASQPHPHTLDTGGLKILSTKNLEDPFIDSVMWVLCQ